MTWLRAVHAIAIVLTAGLLAAQAQSISTFEKSPLSIETALGRVDFVVEVAKTSSERAQGLMFRQSMAADAGMLFDYRRPRPVAMWMKNTYLPLDMLFIASDGRIVTIAERAVPRSLKAIPSGQTVRAALELNGGTVARLGIRPGDRVIHDIFDTTPK